MEMMNFGKTAELLKCSFCGHAQKQVKRLIAGPGVYICDGCIDRCNDIIEEESSQPSETPTARRWLQGWWRRCRDRSSL